jgi:hypothetical protein
MTKHRIKTEYVKVIICQAAAGRAASTSRLLERFPKPNFVSSLDGVTDTLIEMRLPLAMLAALGQEHHTLKPES